MNFVNMSVRTRIFFVPSFADFNTVKSIATTSRDLEENIWPIG